MTTEEEKPKSDVEHAVAALVVAGLSEDNALRVIGILSMAGFLVTRPETLTALVRWKLDQLGSST